MKINIEHQRVLITAGARGIGRATAEAFLTNGAHVHICDINADALAECQATLPAITTTVADVSNPDQVDRFIAEGIAQMGGVDVLVNNAGISGPAGPLEDVEVDAWQQTLDVNINSQFYTCRRVIPHLKAQRSGSIVNISSTAGLFGYPMRSPYAVSKWAVVGLTKTLAMELGEYNIRVNAICPGSINNPRMEHVFAIESEATGRPVDQIRTGYQKAVSLQTFIEPEEIANMVLFICSPLGVKISGQALSVDGHTETIRAV
ncbi:MAG: SDR family oxidoreductase [Chloroflexota bacterium]